LLQKLLHRWLLLPAKLTLVVGTHKLVAISVASKAVLLLLLRKATHAR
jgi:hypothetical protein